MKLTSLRSKHPFFYKRATSLALLFTYMALLLFFGYDKFASSTTYTALRDIIPSTAWGILYGIAGIGSLVSLNFLKDKYVRAFVAFGVGMSTMWSIGLLVVFLYGYDIGAIAFALFAFIAYSGYQLVTDPLYEVIDEEKIEKIRNGYIN